MANLIGVEYKQAFQDHIKDLAPAGTYDSGICVLLPSYAGAIATGDDVLVAKLPDRAIVIRASVIGVPGTTVTLKQGTETAPGTTFALGSRLDASTDL